MVVGFKPRGRSPVSLETHEICDVVHFPIGTSRSAIAVRAALMRVTLEMIPVCQLEISELERRNRRDAAIIIMVTKRRERTQFHCGEMTRTNPISALVSRERTQSVSGCVDRSANDGRFGPALVRALEFLRERTQIRPRVLRERTQFPTSIARLVPSRKWVPRPRAR